jgi:hypothetical protein
LHEKGARDLIGPGRERTKERRMADDPAGVEAVDQPRATEADVEALEQKLQALSDTLTGGERAALVRLLAMAEAGDKAVLAQRSDDVQAYFQSNVYSLSANRVSLEPLTPLLCACGSCLKLCTVPTEPGPIVMCKAYACKKG